MAVSMLTASFTTILVSLMGAIINEVFSWYTTYRTPAYQRLKSHMGKKSKELEKCKSEVPPLDVSKKHDKRVAKLQDDLKTANMELAVMRMRSALFLSVSMLILHALLARMFGGVVVAKLPFQPYSLFYGVTHRTLTGLDYTDCSFTFIYILSSIAIRTNFIKAFGEQPPKGSTSNLFELPKDMDKES